MDVDGDGSIAEDEALSETFFDGAGRVFKTRSPHPGSTGGWSAVKTEYDILGRMKKQSVPTEVDSGWDPAGDDLTRGFLWTHQKYDWMGRVVRKINTDGIDQTTLNASDVVISYEGCGCAGGLVTTIEGELVPRTDTTGNARRKQKVYQDILGRTFKAETFEWDGSTVYSAVVNTFNGRDQVVQARQYAGSTSSTTFQDTTASFDGHGRLSSSHRPEQRDGTTLKYATYSYNPDDSIQAVTDARGAVTSYTYNSRGLLTGKGWTVPGGSGISDPADVSFGYDDAGNRTSMTDGLGSVAYAYDPLSRLISETRTFSDTLAEKPAGNFNISYQYTVGSILKSYTDPYGEEIESSHDKVGRLGSVTGSSFGGVTNYAHSPVYRGWGALKHLEYGSGFAADIGYNNRLQPVSYLLDNTGDSLPATFDRTYEYYSDGRLKLLDNVATDALTTRYDRFFSYDHAGRVKEASATDSKT
jgi:YD repeat-containing protein